MIQTAKTAFAEYLAGEEVPTITPSKPEWDTEHTMKCLVWNGIKDMEYVSDHPRPLLTHPKDILLRVTATTICGSDLHLYRGTFPGMKKGDIQGHEFMGIIEQVGSEVKKVHTGQRVVVSFCIACGMCPACKREEYSSCYNTNPSKVTQRMYNDRTSAIYGYSHLTGGVPGGHAEYVRVAFADVNCFPVPDNIPDEKALYLTDIIPTALYGAVMGEVGKGSVVAIWGLGPIGLMCVRWCQLMGAKRVIGLDAVKERLQIAQAHLGIEVIDITQHKGKVVEAINDLMGDDELDVAIECAGFDYVRSWWHKIEVAVGLETDTSEIFDQMIRAVRKCGHVSVLGVYSGYANHFPVGAMMEKGLTIRGGQCPMQKYLPESMKRLQSGEVDPSFLVTHRGTLADGPRFFSLMANQEEGCIKVFMRPENYRSTNETENQGTMIIG